VAVHRKGATRAFGPGRREIPDRYRAIGQPVLLPGDMGRASYLLVGTEKAMQETFGSSAHGAGRRMSRSQALREAAKRNILAELKERKVEVMAAGKKTIAEEMPEAYKDVSAVAEVMHRTGISLKVARFRPVGVIKG
jgi:tRNA-splicing ligase RtcB